MVRAGAVPVGRSIGYGVLALFAVAAVTAATVAVFGVNRVFTGVLIGLAVGVALMVALFSRDSIVLADDAIHLRVPWSETLVEWDRVVAARFTLDEKSRWSLALDLAGGDERHGELVLLSIPPVHGPVSGAYDLRKRDQVQQIREMLRGKRVPVTVLPEIAAALSEHWKIAPPTR